MSQLNGLTTNAARNISAEYRETLAAANLAENPTAEQRLLTATFALGRGHTKIYFRRVECYPAFIVPEKRRGRKGPLPSPSRPGVTDAVVHKLRREERVSLNSGNPRVLGYDIFCAREQ